MAVNTELFLSAIQSKPPIWQSKHPHHSNRTITRKLWSEIKDLFPGSEEKQLRKKWKNLRDQFRKEKKKFPTPRSGDGGNEIESTWPYFQLMQFINDDITPEIMTGNLHDSDSESLNESCQTEQSNIADVMSPGTSTCSSRTNASKRNKTASDYRDELIECERKKIMLIEQKMVSNSDQSEKCDDYHFFMSLLPQMKKFSELQKLRIRNKITQIIIDEAERMQFSQPRYEENYGGYSTGNYPNY